MARDGADVLVKKNSKLETFLKRNLSVGTFERIRAHEACIVCSQKEDKAFKFVILSDEWIYLTENPPKKIQETVHLKDVISIELVNEFPDFLSGEERENAQHIAIKFKTEPPKTRKKWGSLKDRNGETTWKRTNSARSTKSLPASFPHRDSSKKSQKSVRISPLAQRKSRTAREDKDGHKKKPLGGSIDANTLRYMLDKARTEGEKEEENRRNDMNQSSDSLHNSQRPSTSRDLGGSTAKQFRPPPPLPDITLTDAENPSKVTTLSSNLASTMLNRYSSSKYDHIRKLPRPLPNPTEEWDENGEYIDKRKKERSRLSISESGELKLDLPEVNGDASQDEEEESDDEEYFPTDRSKSNAQVPRVSINERETDSGATNGQTDSQGEQTGETESTIHLYILNYSSPILMLTRSAWNNYLIRATVMMDLDVAERSTEHRRNSLGDSEKLYMLFGQLKREMLASGNSMEQIFDLVNEFKTAAMKNFMLKKLFWKAPDMFAFFIKQLQHYLPQSPCNVNSDRGRQRRADEFELIILFVETLCLMFRETEILPARIQSLKAARGKAALDLIVVLTCFPEVPARYKPPSTKAAALLNTTNSDQWRCYADAEVSKLVQEFTNCAAALLSELILIAHQANWGDKDGNFFNLCWVIKVLEELSTTEKFVERVISQAMRLISPSKRIELEPLEAVLVFQLFSVLQTFVEYSPQIANFIRNNYYEEFKYYIQAPVILEKLPSSYPITPYTIRIIQEVMSSVLQKSAKLQGSTM